jgi:hypothetical protein
MFISLGNDSFKVNTSWLESLILDVFPFKYDDLKLSLNQPLDLEDYIITGKCEILEESRYLKDFLLI